jgi:phosphatidylinositol glycan class O
VVRGLANVLGARYFVLPSAWAAAALLHQKPLGGAATAVHLVQTLCLLEALSASSPSSSSSGKESSLGPAALALLGNMHFFTTGHQAVLASMQWDAAFIPLRTLSLPFSALPMALNAAGPQLLGAIAAPAAALWRAPLPPASSSSARAKGARGGGSAFAGAVRAALTALAVQGALALATCVCAMWLRRHLMLYRVFCPRWLLASAVLGVAWVGAGIAVGGLRWCFLSVGRVRGRVLE